ncbi:MAG: glycoside hydrolase family 2 protein, partial [Marivirga sp.]|nr:glycoside hydrolase family 2 protein [Marivirga sp.]
SEVHGNEVKTEGKSVYKTVVIPHCKYIPLKTFQKIISMAEQGATVIALEGLPESIAGYNRYQENRNTFEGIVNNLGPGKQVAPGVKKMMVGDGIILVGDSIGQLLSEAAIRKETLLQMDIQFIRKKKGADKTIYFISNNNGSRMDGWVPIQVKAASAILYDPMNGEVGSALVRANGNATEVYVHLDSAQTLIIETQERKVETSLFKYYTAIGSPIELSGKWNIGFESGGPTLPSPIETDSLTSWTNFGQNDHASFSGTATYSLSFPKPKQSAVAWMLDLGSVKESADVSLNGKPIGTLIGPVYHLYIDGSLLQENNKLEISVSNLMANRISDMDRKKIFWRKFYNVNFPSRKPENRKNGLFDASHWPPKESGLLGPVRLVPVSVRSQ